MHPNSIYSLRNIVYFHRLLLFGTQFFCNIPSLLICEHCEKAGKRAKGHHVSYCYQKFRSSKNNQKEQSDQRLMKNKESEYHEKKPKQSEKETQFESLGTITRSRIRQKTVKSSDEKGLNSESERSKEVNESPNLELPRA